MKTLLATLVLAITATTALAESTLGDRTVERQAFGSTSSQAKGEVSTPRADGARFITGERHSLAEAVKAYLPG